MVIDQHAAVTAQPVQRDQPVRPGRLRHRLGGQQLVHGDAAPRGGIDVGGRHRLLGEPGEDVPDAALPRLVAPEPGDDAAVHHAAHAPHPPPHIPGTSPSSAAFITWQVEVPMIATICPGPAAPAAGTVTCASTLPAATAMSSGKPVHSAAWRVSDPARAPSGSTGCSSLSAAKPANPGSSAARNSRDG